MAKKKPTAGKKTPADDEDPLAALLAEAARQADPDSPIGRWVRQLAAVPSISSTFEPHKTGERPVDWTWKDRNSEG